MAVPGRTVKDIRTNSGRVDQISQPYRAFMRISALEMEKARRGMERKSAMERIDQIDARFREIEGEKKVLLGALGELDRKSLLEPGSEREEAPLKSSTGFQIKY